MTLAPECLAQTSATSVRHAGTYHVSSGTWTRSAPHSSADFAGADTVYSNTASTGYFLPFNSTGTSNAGGWTYDEGGLPGPSNPDHGSSLAARDEYCITGLQIGYCDNNPAGTSGWELSFYEGYTQPLLVDSPNATITVTGLPADGCWTVNLDLSGGQEFTMGADGGASNPGWDGVLAEDRFSWSVHYAGSDGSRFAGFMLSGHPGATDASWSVPADVPTDATGTIFAPAIRCAPGQPGYGTTGYLGRDQIYFEEPPTGGIYGTNFGSTLGTYRNQGNCTDGVGREPFASFHLELYSLAGGCAGQGIHETHCVSFPNSTGDVGLLELFGSARAADDSVELRASRLPVQVVGYFITSQAEGSVANPAGSSGKLCLGGQIGRLLGPGQIKSTGAGSAIALDTALGEWTLGAIPTPTSAYAAAAGLTSHFQLWHRDSNAGVPTSNFSNGARITWE
jgi:hypothetical protein